MTEKRKYQKLNIFGEGVFLLKKPILDLLESFQPTEFGGDFTKWEDVAIKEKYSRHSDLLIFCFWSTSDEYTKIKEIITDVYDVEILGN